MQVTLSSALRLVKNSFSVFSSRAEVASSRSKIGERQANFLQSQGVVPALRKDHKPFSPITVSSPNGKLINKLLSAAYSYCFLNFSVACIGINKSNIVLNCSRYKHIALRNIREKLSCIFVNRDFTVVCIKINFTKVKIKYTQKKL